MRKFLDLSLGSVLVAAGLLFLLTPAPLGMPFILIGLLFLTRGSTRTRDAIRSMRARHPAAEATLFRPHPALPRGARYLLLTTRPRHREPEAGRPLLQESRAAVSAARDSG